MPFNTLKTQAALLGVMVRSSAVDKKKLKTQSSEICFRATNAFKNQKYFSKILIFHLMTITIISIIVNNVKSIFYVRILHQMEQH